jgi:hypothetical protein
LHTRTVTTAALIAATATITTMYTRRVCAGALEQQRAKAHAAGYRDGLMHAALGLLDPTPSTRVDAADERKPE